MIARFVAAIFAALAIVGVAACAQPTAGTPTPAGASLPVQTETAVPPPTSTVTARPPVTVTVPPQPTVYVPSPDPAGSGLTPCQSMAANGYSYDEAYSAWADAGYPDNWDADHDGLPCEQSYGEQN
jgi:hypothetical protein